MRDEEKQMNPAAVNPTTFLSPPIMSRDDQPLLALDLHVGCLHVCDPPSESHEQGSDEVAEFSTDKSLEAVVSSSPENEPPIKTATETSHDPDRNVHKLLLFVDGRADNGDPFDAMGSAVIQNRNDAAIAVEQQDALTESCGAILCHVIENSQMDAVTGDAELTDLGEHMIKSFDVAAVFPCAKSRDQEEEHTIASVCHPQQLELSKEVVEEQLVKSSEEDKQGSDSPPASNVPIHIDEEENVSTDSSDQQKQQLELPKAILEEQPVKSCDKDEQDFDSPPASNVSIDVDEDENVITDSSDQQHLELSKQIFEEHLVKSSDEDKQDLHSPSSSHASIQVHEEEIFIFNPSDVQLLELSRQILTEHMVKSFDKDGQDFRSLSASHASMHLDVEENCINPSDLDLLELSKQVLTEHLVKSSDKEGRAFRSLSASHASIRVHEEGYGISNPRDPQELATSKQILEQRLAMVLEGAIENGFLNVKRAMGNRRGSTGSMFLVEESGFQKNLNPTMAALLEPLLAIDEGSMEWRNLILHDLAERRQRAEEAMALERCQFVHPLHAAEDPHEQRRRLYQSSEDDVSVMTFDSVSTSWSLAATCRMLFQSASKGSRLTGAKGGKRSGRRFLDLTINCTFDAIDDDGDISQCDALEGDVDSLDQSDTATVFSIPIQKKAKEEERSEARQFLDLTNEVDYDRAQEGKGEQSMRNVFSWVGRQGSVSLINAGENVRHPARITSPDDACDDAASADSDDEDPKAPTTWETADAAFIETVHEISSNLERRMNEQGFESPFWAAEEIIPPFEGLHEKIKNNIERSDTQSGSSPSDNGDPELNTNEEPVVLTSAKVKRVSLRLFAKKHDLLTARSLPRLDDSTGGYDDLGMRPLHRDNNAYLLNFLYTFRSDGFCVLPVVLASGLDKPLNPDTIDVALNILQNLTSPLRRRRQGTMQMVSEEDEDLIRLDASGISDVSIVDQDAFELVV